jgi:hypothetical protein
MVRSRPDHLWRNQVPEIPSSIREMMSDPAFELGVADVRAGRSRRPDYDFLARDQRSMEIRARPHVGLAHTTKRPTETRRQDNNEAISWYARHDIEIICRCKKAHHDCAAPPCGAGGDSAAIARRANAIVALRATNPTPNE